MLGSFQCRGVSVHWVILGQGPTVLAVSEGVFGQFSPLYRFRSLHLSAGDGYAS